MHLELGDFLVQDVAFGDETQFANGVLTIDAAGLRDHLLTDQHFADVAVDVVQPGESVRIHNIVDVSEPRVRVTAPGTDFPGILSPPVTVGEGRTHRLAGTAVVTVSEPVPGESTYWRTAIVDMAGPAAVYSPFGALANVVLSFQPRAGQFPEVTNSEDLNLLAGTAHAAEYSFAVRKAGLRASAYLAESVRSLKPDRVTAYDLDPGKGNGSLPRVIYMCQAFGVYAYGEPTANPGNPGPGALPTIIHPNEILDGALVNLQTWPACHRDVTYIFQNHPVIEELYRRHGSDLNFCGVVLYTRGGDARSKERMTSYNANLVRMLHGDAAILTYVGSGHSLVDVMMTCQKLERENVKTVVLLPEMAGGADDSGLIYFVPEADAMVSTGNYEAHIDFPAVDKVIGGPELFETGAPAEGPLRMPLRTVLAATDPQGSWKVRGWTS